MNREPGTIYTDKEGTWLVREDGMEELQWLVKQKKEKDTAEIDARTFSPLTHYDSSVTNPDFELFTDLVGGEEWMTDDEKDAYS